jgi:hypothetical protein
METEITYSESITRALGLQSLMAETLIMILINQLFATGKYEGCKESIADLKNRLIKFGTQ